MNIRWRRQAEHDLNAAFDYILERNPEAARRIEALIHQRVNTLADNPGLGRPGRIEGTRELVITGTPYIVPYTVDMAAQTVVILRVLHGAQQYPPAEE